MNDPMTRLWNEHTELNRLIWYVFRLGFRKPVCIALDGLLFFLSIFLCDSRSHFIVLFLLLFCRAKSSSSLWCFECFDLVIYHAVRCTVFIYINRCMRFLLQIKLFAFDSVAFKVYRPFFFVCLQTLWSVSNLISAQLQFLSRSIRADWEIFTKKHFK